MDDSFFANIAAMIGSDGSKTLLNETFNFYKTDPQFELCWPATLARLLDSVTISNNQLIYFIMEFCMEQLEESPKAVWADSFLPLIAKGFFILFDVKEVYLSWLTYLRRLLETKHSIIVRNETSGKSSSYPTAFSFTGVFCMISYVDRFIVLGVRVPEYDAFIAEHENTLTQLAAKAMPDNIIFPFAFVASNIMDFFSAPTSDARNLEEVAGFLNSYFAIELPSWTPAPIIASVEAIDSWRAILSIRSSITEISLNAYARNVFFVQAIFQQNCFVELATDGRFRKKSDGPLHTFDSHMGYILDSLKGCPKSRLDILYNCVLFLDSFCDRTKPICCKKIPNTGYLFGLEKSLGFPVVLNSVLDSILSRKNIIPADRLMVILSVLRSYVEAKSKTQENLIEIISSIEPKFLNLLKKDYAAVPSHYPILGILLDTIIKNDNVPYMDIGNEQFGITWYCSLVPVVCPEVWVKCWYNLQRRKMESSNVSVRFLESIEAGLEVIHSRTFFSKSFQEMCTLLNADKLPDVLSTLSAHNAKLYFLKMLTYIQKNKRMLFRLNCEVLEWVRSAESIDEDGEIEEGAVSERTDDYLLAFDLFIEDLPELCPSLKTIEQYLEMPTPSLPTSKNLLLVKELLALLPSNPKKRYSILKITDTFLDVLSTTLPPSILKESWTHALQGDTSQVSNSTVFHFAWVSFMFTRKWALAEYATQVINMAAKDYNSQNGFYAAFHEYLNGLESSKLELPLSFLKRLALHLASQLGNFPSKKSKELEKLVSSNPFLSPPLLPMFLLNCLSSLQPKIIESFFSSIIAEGPSEDEASLSKALQSSTYIKVIWILLQVGEESEKKVKVQDAIMKSIFLSTQDTPSLSKHYHIIGPPLKRMVAKYLHQAVTAPGWKSPSLHMIQRTILAHQCPPKALPNAAKEMVNFLTLLF